MSTTVATTTTTTATNTSHLSNNSDDDSEITTTTTSTDADIYREIIGDAICDFQLPLMSRGYNAQFDHMFGVNIYLVRARKHSLASIPQFTMAQGDSDYAYDPDIKPFCIRMAHNLYYYTDIDDTSIMHMYHNAKVDRSIRPITHGNSLFLISVHELYKSVVSMITAVDSVTIPVLFYNGSKDATGTSFVDNLIRSKHVQNLKTCFSRDQLERVEKELRPWITPRSDINYVSALGGLPDFCPDNFPGISNRKHVNEYHDRLWCSHEHKRITNGGLTRDLDGREPYVIVDLYHNAFTVIRDLGKSTHLMVAFRSIMAQRIIRITRLLIRPIVKQSLHKQRALALLKLVCSRISGGVLNKSEMDRIWKLPLNMNQCSSGIQMHSIISRRLARESTVVAPVISSDPDADLSKTWRPWVVNPQPQPEQQPSSSYAVDSIVDGSPAFSAASSPSYNLVDSPQYSPASPEPSYMPISPQYSPASPEPSYMPVSPQYSPASSPDTSIFNGVRDLAVEDIVEEIEERHRISIKKESSHQMTLRSKSRRDKQDGNHQQQQLQEEGCTNKKKRRL